MKSISMIIAAVGIAASSMAQAQVGFPPAPGQPAQSTQLVQAANELAYTVQNFESAEYNSQEQAGDIEADANNLYSAAERLVQDAEYNAQAASYDYSAVEQAYQVLAQRLQSGYELNSDQNLEQAWYNLEQANSELEQAIYTQPNPNPFPPPNPNPFPPPNPNPFPPPFPNPNPNPFPPPNPNPFPPPFPNPNPFPPPFPSSVTCWASTVQGQQFDATAPTVQQAETLALQVCESSRWQPTCRITYCN